MVSPEEAVRDGGADSLCGLEVFGRYLGAFVYSV
jgi:hypothetical protein